MPATRKFFALLFAAVLLGSGGGVDVMAQAPAPASAAANQPEVYVQLGHTSYVMALAVSADGKVLASGDMAGHIKLWDSATAREFATVPPLPLGIGALAFHPDGKTFYAVSVSEPRIAVIDATTGALKRSWLAGTEKNDLRGVVVIDQGRTLVTAGIDGKVRGWSTDDDRLLFTHDAAGEVTSLVLSPRGDRLAAGGAKSIRVWRLPGFAALGDIDAPDRIGALTFSAGGESLFAGFGSAFIDLVTEQSIREYAMQPFGREAPPIRDFFGVLTGLAVSADGRELYASLNPKLIDFDNMRKPDAMNSRLLAFDLTQRRWLRSETGHLQKISALAIDPLRQRLFTGSWDNTVRSRETRGPGVKTFSGIGVSVVSLVDASDAALTAVDSLGRVMRWSRASGELDTLGAGVRPAISEYLASQFRQQIGGDSYDRLVGTAPLPRDPGQRIEVESARLAALASAPLDLRKHLEWGGTHQQLATARNATGTLTLFGDKNESRFVLRRFGDDGATDERVLKADTSWLSPALVAQLKPTGDAKAPLFIRTNAIINRVVALNADGSRGVLAFDAYFPRDPDMLINPKTSALAKLDVASGRVTPVNRTPIAGSISAVALSADGRLALTISAFNSAKTPEELFKNDKTHTMTLWDLERDTMVWQTPIAYPSWHLAFSPDGQHVLVGQILYRLDTGAGVRPFPGPTKGISAVAFSADGKSLAIGSYDHRIYLFDLATYDAPRVLAGHGDTITALRFAGDTLLSAADDKTLRHWKTGQSSWFAMHVLFANAAWVTLLPEGYFTGPPEGIDQLGVRQGGRLFDLNQFYDVFYRPDLVRRALAGEDIGRLSGESLAGVLRSPPPSLAVSLLPATAGAARREIEVTASGAGGGIGDIRVFHNGKLVHADAARVGRISAMAGLASVSTEVVTRNLVAQAKSSSVAPSSTKAGPQRLKLSITAVPGENIVTAVAFNGDNSARSRVSRASFTSTATAAPPRVFALAIGINQFRGAADDNLVYAAVDARDMSSWYSRVAARLQLGLPQPPVMLLNRAATKAGIAAAIARIAREARPQDALLLFVSTHGVFVDNTYALVTHEYDGTLQNRNLITTGELLDQLKAVAAQRQLLVLDTCHSGGFDNNLAALYDARLSVWARNMGIHVFASAGARQGAIDGYRGNGLFTHVLLRALGSREADSNGDLTLWVSELGAYGRENTAKIAASLNQNQVPTIMRFGNDFPLVRLN